MCMLQTWATVVKDASELTNEELRASFDLIDVDGNGRLNVKELEVRDRPHSNLTLPPPLPPPCVPPSASRPPTMARTTGGDPKRRPAAGPDGAVHMRGVETSYHGICIYCSSNTTRAKTAPLHVTSPCAWL